MAAQAELDFWRRERDEVLRGLHQLIEIRVRAVADPVRVHEEANEMIVLGEVVPDEEGWLPSDEEIVGGYYSGLIAAYERRAVEALRNTNTWALSLAPRSPRTRPRGRESRPRRQRVRSSSAASRDGPDDPDDEPSVGAEPGKAGRLGVRPKPLVAQAEPGA
jgi:hypothetical protein